VGSLFVYEKKA